MFLNHNGVYSVCSDDTVTQETLIPGVYNLCYHAETHQFFLQPEKLVLADDVSGGKIYGNIVAKVEKAYSAYKSMGRNTGILLSGIKGSGKTVFARQLTHVCQYDMPVIIVKEYVRGFDDFILSVKQPCVYIMDEFDKFFGTGYSSDQISPDRLRMLTVLDGMHGGNNMFVATCNHPECISDLMVNRPGRFHYHFRFGGVKAKDIKEYMRDNLGDMYSDDTADMLIKRCVTIDITYDILRSVCFELRRGYTLMESLEDLNLQADGERDYTVTATVTNGESSFEVGNNCRIQFGNENRVWLTNKDYTEGVTVVFLATMENVAGLDNGGFTFLRYSIDSSGSTIRVSEPKNQRLQNAPSCKVSNLRVVPFAGNEFESLF